MPSFWPVVTQLLAFSLQFCPPPIRTPVRTFGPSPPKLPIPILPPLPEDLQLWNLLVLVSTPSLLKITSPLS